MYLRETHYLFAYETSTLGNVLGIKGIKSIGNWHSTETSLTDITAKC